MADKSLASPWLNYNHLYYFWTVARLGSVTKAADELRLAQPTISEQLRSLEQQLDEKLFERVGRGLQLTPAGDVALRYANQIFPLGNELLSAVKGDQPATQLVVGIADVLPKLVAYKLLEPARMMRPAVKIICKEGRPERLAADLALYELDIILSDAPLTQAGRTKIHSQLLGECGVSLFASKNLAGKYKRNYPRSLSNAPFLLPSEDSAMRKSLDSWFKSRNIKPNIVAEFADSALLRIFGEAGDGIFPVPTIIETDFTKQKELQLVGRLREVREVYYAVTSNRSRKNPAVTEVADAKLTRG